MGLYTVDRTFCSVIINSTQVMINHVLCTVEIVYKYYIGQYSRYSTKYRITIIYIQTIIERIANCNIENEIFSKILWTYDLQV